MYDKSDPRAALASASAAKPLPSSYDAADYLRFYGTDPQETGPGARTWLGRGQNFLTAYTEAEAGAELVRTGQPDEYAILLPDHATRIEVTADGETKTVDGYHLVFVPPGDSTVRLLSPGAGGAIFTTRAGDLTALCSNAAAYAAPHATVAPVVDWPTPPGGFRIRAYSLDVPTEPGRFGRIWRCTTLMVNWLDHYDGPRDPSKLSPHHHDDFEQGSLAVEGEFIHHLRWPWTTNKAAWRADDHEFCGDAFHHVYPAALHPHDGGMWGRAQPVGGPVLPTAHGFLDEARLGAECRRLPDAIGDPWKTARTGQVSGDGYAIVSTCWALS